MIKLPRNYLSWSALSLFEQDPEEFKRIYFLGGEKLDNKYTRFGTQLAKALETGEDSGNKGIENAKIFIPKFQFHEKTLIVKGPTCKLLAKMDGFDKDPLIIHEIKSGKAWNQSRVDKHGQLTHYAYVVWLKYKKIPKILLHWVKTEDFEDGVRATGEVRTFETQRLIGDFLEYEQRVKNCYESIVEMAKEINKIIA